MQFKTFPDPPMLPLSPWTSLEGLRQKSGGCPVMLRPRLRHILGLLEVLWTQAELLRQAGALPALERAMTVSLSQSLERYATLSPFSARWLRLSGGLTAYALLADYLNQLERVLTRLRDAAEAGDLMTLRLEVKALEEGFHRPLRFGRSF